MRGIMKLTYAASVGAGGPAANKYRCFMPNLLVAVQHGLPQYLCSAVFCCYGGCECVDDDTGDLDGTSDMPNS